MIRYSLPFSLLKLSSPSAVAFVLLLVCGCGLLANDQEATEQAIASNARVAFGSHIEGVTVRSASPYAIEQLGEPDTVVRGDFPGVTYRYTQGSVAGIEVELTDETLPEADRDGVIVGPGGAVNVCAYAPYDGKTEEGIGIGTPREKAHRLLGTPDNTLSLAWISEGTPREWYDEYAFDEYAFEDVVFRIEYRRTNKEIYSICAEPQANEGSIITNAEGRIEQLYEAPYVDGNPRFAIRPDFDPGTRMSASGVGVPEAFRKDSLRVVFSGHELPLPIGHVTATPLHLISIEKLS